MRISYEHSPEFQKLLDHGQPVDLTRIALEIASDAYPNLELLRYLARLDELASRVFERCPAGLKQRQILGHINWVLFVEEGFHGNTADYYDPRNSYLNEVLDRRTGIPLSLPLVYLALADRIGLPMAGVNLPAHFVLRLRESPAFVDPFHQGRLLDREGCRRQVAEVTGQEEAAIAIPESALAPCPPRVIVTRMLRNLKATYLQRQEFDQALPVLRRLAALDASPLERRDLGIVCMHLDRPGEAVNHLQAYLESLPSASDVDSVRLLLKAAWRDFARRN